MRKDYALLTAYLNGAYAEWVALNEPAARRYDYRACERSPSKSGHKINLDLLSAGDADIEFISSVQLLPQAT